MIPPKERAVCFSPLRIGVPVNPTRQDTGSARRIAACKLPVWVRCPSSTNTNTFGSAIGLPVPLVIFLANASNLWIVVVMTRVRASFSKFSSWPPDVARMTFSSPRTRLNVSAICSSRSTRSVTTTTRGESGAYTVITCDASMHIVRLLPLPWVCHTMPPVRRPSLPIVSNRRRHFFTQVYCW